MTGKIRIPIELETKSFDKQIEETERKLELLTKSADETGIPQQFRRSKDEAKALNAEIEKTNNKLIELRKRKKQVDEENSVNFSNWLTNSEKGLTNNIKKIARYGLALLSVHSIYSLISRSASLLGQENEQLGADMENIRYGLASSMLPIIQTIVDWVYKLMQYVNAIWNAWFGHDLFKQSAKSLGKANKSAKELKNTMAGFDEMQTVGSKSSSGSSADGGGALPSQSFQLEGEVPKWLQWIMDNKDTVLTVIGAIVAGFAAMKLGLLDIGNLFKSLGIALILGGIAVLVEGIIAFIEDPSWDNFATILAGLAMILGGVAIAMLAVNAANPVAWIVLAIAAVVALTALIIKNWDTIKSVIGSIANWIKKNIIDPIANFFTGLVNGIINGAKNILNGIKLIFSSIVLWAIGIITSIKNVFVSIGTKIGDAVAGAFKGVVNAVLKTMENILNTPIKATNKMIDTINTLPGVNIGTLSTFRLPRLAKGGIVNLPSRGVPIGNAIAGEAGAEGVIPLTDSQQMSLLGEAIGKYITVNLTNVTSLDGRTIARKTTQINNNKNFAMNR